MVNGRIITKGGGLVHKRAFIRCLWKAWQWWFMLGHQDNMLDEQADCRNRVMAAGQHNGGTTFT